MKRKNFAIDARHIEITKTILNKNISNSISVWIFGSRVHEKTKPYSDLDIALQSANNETIPLKTIASLKADFIDSDLPWKVDVFDYNSISGIFKENVDATKIKFST
jgi:predicted nucleotidyltransferase